MTPEQARDALNSVRVYFRPLIDKRFQLTPFTISLHDGVLQACLDFYNPKGPSSSVTIMLDKGTMAGMSVGEVVGWVEQNIRLANDDLKALVDGEETQ